MKKILLGLCCSLSLIFSPVTVDAQTYLCNIRYSVVYINNGSASYTAAGFSWPGGVAIVGGIFNVNASATFVPVETYVKNEHYDSGVEYIHIKRTYGTGLVGWATSTAGDNC